MLPCSGPLFPRFAEIMHDGVQRLGLIAMPGPRLHHEPALRKQPRQAGIDLLDVALEVSKLKLGRLIEPVLAGPRFERRAEAMDVDGLAVLVLPMGKASLEERTDRAPRHVETAGIAGKHVLP